MINVETDVTSGYLGDAFNPDRFNMVVRSFKAAVKKNVFGDFEAIAVRGVSGLLFGPTLAHVAKKRLLVIRKPGESAHTSYLVEGYTAAKSYIIVDDFVSSGSTVESICKAIRAFCPAPILVGCYMWHGTHNYSSDIFRSSTYKPQWTGKPQVNYSNESPFFTVHKLYEDC